MPPHRLKPPQPSPLPAPFNKTQTTASQRARAWFSSCLCDGDRHVPRAETGPGGWFSFPAGRVPYRGLQRRRSVRAGRTMCFSARCPGTRAFSPPERPVLPASWGPPPSAGLPPVLWVLPCAVALAVPPAYRPRRTHTVCVAALTIAANPPRKNVGRWHISQQPPGRCWGPAPTVAPPRRIAMSRPRRRLRRFVTVLHRTTDTPCPAAAACGRVDHRQDAGLMASGRAGQASIRACRSGNPCPFTAPDLLAGEHTAFSQCFPGVGSGLQICDRGFDSHQRLFPFPWPPPFACVCRHVPPASRLAACHRRPLAVSVASCPPRPVRHVSPRFWHVPPLSCW